VTLFTLGDHAQVAQARASGVVLVVDHAVTCSNRQRPARPTTHLPEEEDPMIKQVCALVAAMFLAAGATQAFAQDKEACEKQAAEKKLAGAAKNSFVKKCAGGAAASPAAEACAKQAAEKKLAGAAKNSFTKKCLADAK
jgi:hypothetical protein